MAPMTTTVEAAKGFAAAAESFRRLGIALQMDFHRWYYVESDADKQARFWGLE